MPVLLALQRGANTTPGLSHLPRAALLQNTSFLSILRARKELEANQLYVPHLPALQQEKSRKNNKIRSNPCISSASASE